MNKKINLLILTSIIILFFIFTYKNNIIERFSKNIQTKNELNILKKSKDIDKKISNILKNVSYENYDQKGNFYQINSDTSESYQDKPFENFMKNVTAKITLIGGREILITSDYAIYNRENNNTNFFDNVIIIESNNKITANKLDFIYITDMIFLRENIVMNNEFGTLLSDMVDINLNEGIAKIYMTDNKEQVKVNYEKND